ncbi:MAG: hypothetical protein IPM25_07775 [Chloracidobacterium sp.]|nr:hypothetical protein [Chloracidobacterium sp.]
MGMIYHVLPGDSITREFNEAGIEGEMIVFRECLVAGDADAASLEEFWDIRANFHELEHGGDPIDYREGFVHEVERLIGLDRSSEVHLWFEYELFCSANMWFCLNLLKGSEAAIFRVMPSNVEPDDVWKGFGRLDADGLIDCFQNRVKLTADDVAKGAELWSAFAKRDAKKLIDLGSYRSPAFPFLLEVTAAAAEIESRPAEILAEIKSGGLTGMSEIFPEFVKRAGVYGFGDTHVERLLDRI